LGNTSLTMVFLMFLISRSQKLLEFRVLYTLSCNTRRLWELFIRKPNDIIAITGNQDDHEVLTAAQIVDCTIRYGNGELTAMQ